MRTHKGTAVCVAGKPSHAQLFKARDRRDRLCQAVQSVQVGRGYKDVQGLLYNGRDLLTSLGTKLPVHYTEVRGDLIREAGVFAFPAHDQLEFW